MSVPFSLQHELKTVDSSGRISLGRAKAGALYDAVYETDGRVILTPMVAIPERERWLHRNPEAMALLDLGLAQAARGETTRIDLSQYPADDDGDED